MQVRHQSRTVVANHSFGCTATKPLPNVYPGGPVNLARVDRLDTWCVIGAGAHGLPAIKEFQHRGIDVQAYEREGDVGGNWNISARSSRVYGSTHTISSKAFTAYPDFPMPDDYPDYPHHSQVLAYFQRYADHFGLRRFVAFDTEVESVQPVDGGRWWDVTVVDASGDRSCTRFAGVVVANGHNWNPKIPSYPGLGSFAGEVLHSAAYKDPAVLRGRRVLVVGAGNTGCDLAVESAQQAVSTTHSTRRGYYYNPKYVGGRPADQVADTLLLLRLPLSVRRAMYKLTLRATVGDFTSFGLAKPDHKFYETHPIVNSLLVYYVGQGDIAPKPDVDRFDGSTVWFVDGSSADVDLVLFCTGYLVDFPFLDGPAALNWVGDHPRLHLHLFTPQHDNLFVAGLIQPDSGQWCLAHWQAATLAAYVEAARDRPEIAAAFRREVIAGTDARYSGGTHYTDSTRHYYEVAHQDYLRSLQRAIRSLEASPVGASR